LKQLRTVLAFEYGSYIKSKVFIIITAVLTLAIITAINIPNIRNFVDSFSSSEAEGEGGGGAFAGERKRAAISDPNGQYPSDLVRSFFPEFQFNWREDFSDEDALTAKIESGEYAFAVKIDGLNYTLYEAGIGLYSPLSGRVYNMVETVYRDNLLTEFGLTADEIDEYRMAIPIANIITVGKDMSESFWVGYAMLFLLYLTMTMYGQYVIVSVVTEKSSKTMELLITSVKPVYLMFGKVLGSGLAGLTQLCAVLGAAFVTFKLTEDTWKESMPMVESILGMSLKAETILLALLFFVLGFFIFAFLYAAFGSTVSRMEDANKVIMVPMLLFVASFIVAMIGGMSAPGSAFYITCSYMPFLSPLVMFMRICITEVHYTEIINAVAINVVSIILAGIICAKIYRAGVLMYGKPMKLVEMVKTLIKA
jgi:ABC-2 type transport system permease protein